MSQTLENAALDRGRADELLGRFRGEVVLPDDDGYEQPRKVWNGSIERWPAAALRCAGAADVLDGLQLVRELDLPVALRGGGHNIAGFGTCDGGVVLDLSPMKGVRVDPEARTARAEPGLVWTELDRETQAFALAVTGGVMSSTGVAGFTLGGGMGWLQRKLGLACDNLRAADVITADGTLAHASERENRELLWGLRGGRRQLRDRHLAGVRPAPGRPRRSSAGWSPGRRRKPAKCWPSSGSSRPPRPMR